MLRKEEILERTSNGLAVFKHYLPGNWRIGRNFLNPLYEDSKASCNIYFDRRGGIYKMKDFGNDSYSGDCFFLVGQLKGLDCNRAADFVEILEIIDRDLGLGLASGTPVSVSPVTVRRAVPDKPEETPEKPVKPYQFREQKFPLAELVYWQQYGITPELLEHYKVCSLREYNSETAEGKPYTYTSSVAEPMYGYKGKQHIKLYRPFSTPRFLYGGSFGENYCFGLEQLPAKGDTLFITGGEKDVLSLAAHGFHAICFNSETVTIPPTLVYRLTFRFKHIVLLFDMDKTGRESSRNLFGITGGEGTGKSNYVAAIVAGCICPAGAEVDTLGVQITANGRHKAVLLYDTEQSEVQLFKNVSNLLARAKQPDKPDELKAFCLTGMSRKERLNAIVQSMDKFYYQYGGIQLVVIDGIADLVKSANDEAESVAVIDELYRLAGIYNTCILCVLHFVPNGLKLRGHLGSELQRKAATILSIEKDDEPAQSVVKALKVRDGSPLDVPLMLFAWDKEAGMHVYKGEKPREEKEKRKERELVNVARDIFGRQTRITYIDLCEQLQQVLDIKERTAKSYIRFMRERDIITKDTANQSCFVIGSYNLRWNTGCP